MTKDQILQLVKEHFKEGGLRDDGSSSEYYGDPDTFVKFTKAIYDMGKSDGYEDGRYDGYSAGYDAAFCEHGGY